MFQGLVPPVILIELDVGPFKKHPADPVREFQDKGQSDDKVCPSEPARFIKPSL